MNTTAILVGLGLALMRIGKWLEEREKPMPTPLGEPRPTATPPPWGVGA
ncbi:MAG: hypothetical protein JST49_15295 [Bacteroidetes bacterium]|nr:hypothetical protein [Bacteroidota bacterium]